VDLLFDVEVNDGGILSIEVDLFHASDWHAGNQNLAAWLEAAAVGESCEQLVGGTTDGYACAGLDGKPDHSGQAQEDKSADRKFDVGILHTKKELRVEGGPERDDIVAKASHNAIVGGHELRWGSLEMDPALFQ
jgi:hypothetical protein